MLLLGQQWKAIVLLQPCYFLCHNKSAKRISLQRELCWESLESMIQITIRKLTVLPITLLGQHLRERAGKGNQAKYGFNTFHLCCLFASEIGSLPHPTFYMIQGVHPWRKMMKGLCLLIVINLSVITGCLICLICIWQNIRLFRQPLGYNSVWVVWYWGLLRHENTK